MFNKLFSLFIKNSENVEDTIVRASYGKFLNVLCIIFNVFLFAIKLVAGFLSGSVAIMADAVNNLSDASSNVVGFFGFKLANIPADDKHPYGHGRYEYIAGLTVSFLILMIGIELLKSSFSKIIEPTAMVFEWVVVAILITSILVKLFMFLILSVAGKKINSDTLLATATDCRNDVLSTSAVLISLIILKLFNIDLDGYVGLAVAVFILISGVKIILETVETLLGKAPDKEYVEKIRKKIMSYDSVLGTHDLMVHDYGPGRKFASVHIEMPADNDPLLSHEIIDGIEKDFWHDMNLHISIHFDPISTKDELLTELKLYIAKKVKTIDEKITIHDLRIVRGIERNIAVFDIVLPFSVKMEEKEVKEKIDLLIKENYPSFDTNITIDKDFASNQ